MSDRNYPHTRELIENLSVDELRDLADDLALQLASIELALERRRVWSIFNNSNGVDPQSRAARIIAQSTAYRPTG